jgi:hypothetical protein
MSQRIDATWCTRYVVPPGHDIRATVPHVPRTKLGLDETFISFLIHGYYRWSREVV